MTLQEPAYVADLTATVAAAAAASSNAAVAFRTLDLSEIVPSRTNRTNFDQEKLNELADSIRSSGVHTPITVRPLPASRLEETFDGRQKGEPLPGFEIVAGERRFRASILAGKTTIPAIVRALTDSEAVEAQLIENVQREGLHPLEEAEGYELLMQFGENGTGVKPSAEEIGKKVGRSKSYVYARLKLLDLCSSARDAFLARKLDESKALLIARIPSEKRQLAALKDLTAENYYGQTMAYRQAAEHVQRHHMMKLSGARFKITDASLLEGVADCRSCPKRCGSDKELYPDVDGADVCTDPDCYDRKAAAHDAAVRAKAEAEGRVIIDGKEAKKLRPNAWGGIEGHVRLDEVSEGIGGKPLRKVLGAALPPPIVFIDPHTQTAAEVLPKTVVGELLKEKGITPAKSDAASSDGSDWLTKAKAEEKFELTWRAGAAEAIFAAARVSHKKATIGFEVLRIIARELRVGLKSESIQRIAKLVDPKNGKVGAYGAVDDYIDSCTAETIVPLIFLLLAERDAQWMIGASQADDHSRLDALSEETGVYLDAIKKAVKEDLAEQDKEKARRRAAKEAQEKAKNEPSPAGKGKAPAKAAKAPETPPKRVGKMRAEEAKAGIAAALSAADSAKVAARAADSMTGDLLAAAGDASAFVINQAVRVLRVDGASGAVDEWAGRKGIVRAISDGGIISVRFKGRKAGLVTFPPEQLAAITEEA